MNSRGILRAIALQGFSVLIGVYVLWTILAIQAGRAGRFQLVFCVSLLASAVVLRYVSVAHDFSRPLLRAASVVGAAGIVLVVVAVGVFSPDVASPSLHLSEDLFREPLTLVTAIDTQWWIPLLLLVAGLLLVGGAASHLPGRPYATPTSLRDAAISPPWFGLGCAVIGLWAVLFVGIGLQRVVVIAPLFEELLKFGVALVVGSVLFGRSRAGRLGTALAVGLVFGLVEHATTYPDEQALLYLYRCLFHATTAVLSVSAYTTFERLEANELRWLSPAYSILLHFFNNVFSVLGGVLGVAVFGAVSPTVSLVYGGVVILLGVVVLGLTIISPRGTTAIHRPGQQVLSDLV